MSNTRPVVKLKAVISDPPAPPSYETPGAACADIRSNEHRVLWPGSRHIFSTGYAAEIPESWELQVRSRSGLAAKFAITVTHGLGTIDSDYRGEIKILLSNNGDSMVTINKGDRIAQLKLERVEQAHFEIVTELSETARGTGGLGSTGSQFTDLRHFT